MTGDTLIRWSTVAAVLLVAAVAGTVSYLHALAVVSAHGETGFVARIYPGTIDGLIYAASMVLLDSARRRLPAPPLALWLLGAGIAATVAVNVLDGVGHGILGALVAAWPALALVGSYELLMHLVRSATRAPAAAVPPPAEAAAPAAGSTPDSLLVSAEAAYPDVVYGVQAVPSLRSIRATLRIGDTKAKSVKDHLAAIAGGRP